MKKIKSNLVKLTPESRLYHIPVPIIGLTGGIGTGKSTVAAILRKQGIAVIDADSNVKIVYQKPETFEFIKKHFPGVVTSGVIDFKILREIVFINPDAKKLVEDYIYSHLPVVFTEAYNLIQKPELIVYDVPLLFEKKLHLLVDVSVCVYASREVQIKRLVARDHISSDLAEKILSSQMDIEEKKKLSDFQIDNMSDPLQLERNVSEFLIQIMES